MTNGWVEVGQLVRKRRERMGLKQEELQRYGGPKVSTVGKLERAGQDNFPSRTQRALERALGWREGTIRSVLHCVEDGNWEEFRSDYEERLVEDDLPDLDAAHDGDLIVGLANGVSLQATDLARAMQEMAARILAVERLVASQVAPAAVPVLPAAPESDDELRARRNEVAAVTTSAGQVAAHDDESTSIEDEQIDDSP